MSDIIYRHKVQDKNGYVVLTDREFNHRIQAGHIEESSLKDSGAEKHYLDNNRICVITSVWSH